MGSILDKYLFILALLYILFKCILIGFLRISVGTRGPFPGAKVQLGCDTDHPPRSSAEFQNE
jgi:hypothetical protein